MTKRGSIARLVPRRTGPPMTSQRRNSKSNATGTSKRSSTWSRTPPVEQVGRVSIFAPTPSTKYYRLRWLKPDGKRGETTAPTFMMAIVKARGLDASISTGVTRCTKTLAELTEECLALGVSPFKVDDKGNPSRWKKSHQNHLKSALDRSLRIHGDLRLCDLSLDRDLLVEMRSLAGCRSTVRENTRALRGLLYWLTGERLTTRSQGELLDNVKFLPNPRYARTTISVAQAQTEDRARRAGDALDYVRDEDAPSKELVIRLREEMDTIVPLWGALAVELACGSGLRWGEQFQLTSDDAHPDGCDEYAAPHVHVRWQMDAGASAAEPRRCRPKCGIVREAPVFETSWTGFPLRDALRSRITAAKKEQKEGRNPDALLFPAFQGGLQWHTAFNSRILLPAMENADWPIDVFEDAWRARDDEPQFAGSATRRRSPIFTWHSMRHRFARICVDELEFAPGELMRAGGWESLQTVDCRYYRSGREGTTHMLERFAGWRGER